MMPEDVKNDLERSKFKLDKTPGVIIKGEDGSLQKIAAETVDEDVDLDVAPEPTRYDKSLQSILQGRNAAMWIGIECRKRQWELEFECLEADGPVHNRVYSYSLTVGPPGSDDVLVACGIAKGKREGKRRCCDVMVLKMSDLPPAPPLHVQMQMRGMQVRPGFRPRLPPPESEDTIFKKYDKTAYGDDHPNKNHPVFQLCSKAKRLHWPPPQFELVTEKIVDTIRNKHGKSNTMLYTYKVTVWPGVGQVEPKIFFGSGPTKKDAKFACGTIAWAAIQNPNAVKQAQAAVGEGEPVAGTSAGGGGEDAAQLAVKLAAQATGPKLKSAQHITEEKWLQQVAKAAEKSVDLKAEVEQLKAEKEKKRAEEEAKRAEEREKRMKEREEREKERLERRAKGERSRSRSRKRKSERYSRDRSRSRDRSVKKERRSRDRDHHRSSHHRDRSHSREVKKDRRSRSRERKKERRSRSREPKKERRSRSREYKKEKRSRSRDRN